MLNVVLLGNMAFCVVAASDVEAKVDVVNPTSNVNNNDRDSEDSRITGEMEELSDENGGVVADGGDTMVIKCENLDCTIFRRVSRML